MPPQLRRPVARQAQPRGQSGRIGGQDVALHAPVQLADGIDDVWQAVRVKAGEKVMVWVVKVGAS
ncbi:hypothetical protein [Cupriavidus sp. IDO]|uniref:hypothetical protein n=1 Tax=Cupriavidus sp. IDO TaxID=1539142 RepID=UPI00057938F9|nr:hypothetical protein [Cupriavidus sp. IDO]KWR77260.1 hypothetical protein RM96_32000 [Cupriavidus sp. IDO]